MSSPVSIVVLPTNAPTMTDIRVNTETEALISWATSAPFRITPLGLHQAVIEARSMGGTFG